MATNQFSPENFGKRMKQIAEKTGKDVERTAEIAVKSLFTDIIEGTPVGKPETWKRRPPPGYIPGKAKANWMPSVGAIDTSVTESRESSIIRLSQLNGKVAGNTVYLTNSVPYIYALEKGWSYLQQPNGWVERTVRSFEAILTKTVRTLSR